MNHNQETSFRPSRLKSLASRINSLPVLRALSPTASRSYSQDELTGFSASQALAQRCAVEVSKLIQIGWTEIQTANLMETWLRDHGVKTFFHKPFVWWGDRTRFVGVKTYWDYQPTKRALQESEIYILDVAPMLDGYVSDIGFTGCAGINKDFDDAILFLSELRAMIPEMLKGVASGKELWSRIDHFMAKNSYENIHATYPFGVLGHRLHRSQSTSEATFIHFGWQSYWELLSRGLFGQLLNQDFAGSLDGLWAIEPHIGGKNFGAKFEEILIIENGVGRWLGESSCFHTAKR